MDNISKKDYSILFELSINARTSRNKIAKKIKMSQQGFMYRLEQLEDKKVILNYYTIIDYACLGYSCYKVIFTLRQGKKELEPFLKSLQNHGLVLSIFELNGQWDYMVLFACKNASSCSKELHNICLQYPKLIKNYFVLTNVVSYELGRRYLNENIISTNTIVIGGDRKLVRNDETDLQLLKDLYENPRISYVKLSLKYKLNPKTIIKKIRTLQTKGILKGYSVNLDCYNYDYIAQKVFIKFSEFSMEKEDNFLRFCKQNKNIVRIAKLFGQWDFELDIEVPSLKEFQKFCIGLRSSFGENLYSFETCAMIKCEKFTSIPSSLFK